MNAGEMAFSRDVWPPFGVSIRGKEPIVSTTSLTFLSDGMMSDDTLWKSADS